MLSKEPRLAVVVPLYRQPGLVIEALESLLAQRGAPPHVAIVVIDGCPMPESDQVCARYLHAYPGRVLALRQSHRGLSAARNTGARFALAAWPSLEAIYFLDADNRLDPRALERLWDTLQEGADWAYPDIDMIGMRGNYDYAGTYSPLNHLAENICEAGSLVHRRVFDGDLWFDETMRQGYEDWEFWQRAAARGFRGRHAPWVGFRYRRRPESMLAGSDRMREALVGVVTRSARQCWRVRNALAVEHTETPRYALVASGEPPQIGLVTDPRRWRATLTLDEFDATVTAWATDARRFRCPPYVAVIASSWLGSPEMRMRLPGLLWRAEEIADTGAWASAGRGFAFISTSRLLASAQLEAPADLGSVVGHAAAEADAPELIRSLHARLETARAGPSRPWSWRMPSTRPSSAAHLGLRHLAGGGPVLPAFGDRPALALVAAQWPPEGFDAASRTILALGASRWDIHLVLAADDIRFAVSRFATVTSIGEPTLAESSSAADAAYFGTPLPALWEHAPRHDRLVGLLAGMDMVLNLGVHALSAVMVRLGALHLRRWLALPDRPRATPDIALGLAFEHCYDGILAPRGEDADLALARGVPVAKLGDTIETFSG